MGFALDPFDVSVIPLRRNWTVILALELTDWFLFGEWAGFNRVNKICVI